MDPHVPETNHKWDTFGNYRYHTLLESIVTGKYADVRDQSIWFRLPTVDRYIRANRPKLRRLMTEGLNVKVNQFFNAKEVGAQFGYPQTNMQFSSYDIKEDGVVAHFKDGSSFKGDFLVGCDGSASLGRPFHGISTSRGIQINGHSTKPNL